MGFHDHVQVGGGHYAAQAFLNPIYDFFNSVRIADCMDVDGENGDIAHS